MPTVMFEDIRAILGTSLLTFWPKLHLDAPQHPVAFGRRQTSFSVGSVLERLTYPGRAPSLLVLQETGPCPLLTTQPWGMIHIMQGCP